MTKPITQKARILDAHLSVMDISFDRQFPELCRNTASHYEEMRIHHKDLNEAQRCIASLRSYDQALTSNTPGR